MSLSRNLFAIRAAIPSEVKILAVSKGYPPSMIKRLVELGQYDFGESRIQEALPKIDEFKNIASINWHFIGHLQSNKVRKVVRSFKFIHSIDSFELAERVSRISGEENLTPKIFIQVKLRDDPAKGGFSPNKLRDQWNQLRTLNNLCFVGLMAISPIGLSLEERSLLFRECRALADELNLTDCSMGMSSDWLEALEAGATWLRIGSGLFGHLDKEVEKQTDITKK